eukprot:TRINITY_DN4071_c0_g2_i4.p1 TRINITY_DN4071_c0_g2~~TRINITY_DN4071_c0_g2_i4.p1  ORF type:complete len:463 (+),score=60.51 TRINITY_DN4071_c0_g2_i4:1159-2547(+)
MDFDTCQQCFFTQYFFHVSSVYEGRCFLLSFDNESIEIYKGFEGSKTCFFHHLPIHHSIPKIIKVQKILKKIDNFIIMDFNDLEQKSIEKERVFFKKEETNLEEYGFYYIQNRKSRRYLTKGHMELTSANSYRGINAQFAKKRSQDSVWRIYKTNDGFHLSLFNIYTNGYLQMEDPNLDKNKFAKIKYGNYISDTSMQWELIKIENGRYFKIRNYYGSHCLDSSDVEKPRFKEDQIDDGYCHWKFIKAAENLIPNPKFITLASYYQFYIYNQITNKHLSIPGGLLQKGVYLSRPLEFKTPQDTFDYSCAWYIIKGNRDAYSFGNKFTKGFIDGKERGQKLLKVANDDPQKEPTLKWKIIKVGNGQYAFKNFEGKYLTCVDPYRPTLDKEDPKGDKFKHFCLFPIETKFSTENFFLMPKFIRDVVFMFLIVLKIKNLSLKFPSPFVTSFYNFILINNKKIFFN